MREPKKTYPVIAFGKAYNIGLHIEKYQSNGNTAITAWSKEGPFSTLTVNLDYVPGPEYAYIDTNRGWDIEKFIKDNGLGVDTGIKMSSGFCTYPLYKLDLKKIDPNYFK